MQPHVHLQLITSLESTFSKSENRPNGHGAHLSRFAYTRDVPHKSYSYTDNGLPNTHQLITTCTHVHVSGCLYIYIVITWILNLKRVLHRIWNLS